MPHVVTPVTPRLRHTRLRHMVMPHVVTPATPNSVTSHGYTTRAGGEKLCKSMKNFVSLTL